jgi:2'-5' RNA ligase
MVLRIFLALDLDDDIRSGLIRIRDKIDLGGAKVKWVDPEQLHITLKFLGDIADDTVRQVHLVAQQVARQMSPFKFRVRNVLCVPSGGPVRMFWAGVEDAGDSMKSLHGVLDEAMGGLNFRREDREFSPHITLARVKFAPNPQQIRRTVQAVSGADFGVQLVEELVVYSSQLTPSGPVYSAIGRSRFGG